MKVLILKVGSTFPQLQELTDGDFEDWVLQGMGVPKSSAMIFDAVSNYASLSTISLSNFTHIVIPGSHSMVSDKEVWSEETANFIRDFIIPSKIPTLGICYGHQLISHSIGGIVDYLPNGPERGCIPLIIDTTALKNDPLFSKAINASNTATRVFACHSQTVLKNPPGTIVIATSAMDSNQILRIAERVWSVQHHPEFSKLITEEYMKHLGLQSQLPLLFDDNGYGKSLLQAFASLS